MSFMIDLKFARKYEKHFAELLGFNLNNSVGNDHGCDIYKDDIIIDVKCYKKPIFVNQFSGVFLECYMPNGLKPGWYLDDTKITTHYLLAKDCDNAKVKYEKAWLISKENLKKATNEARINGHLELKQYPTIGFILPYYYLDKYVDCKIAIGGIECD